MHDGVRRRCRGCPGRKTSSALPVREAKTAAMRDADQAVDDELHGCRCTSRTASSATARPMPTIETEPQVVADQVRDGEAEGRDGALDHAAPAAERDARAGAGRPPRPSSTVDRRGVAGPRGGLGCAVAHSAPTGRSS